MVDSELFTAEICASGVAQDIDWRMDPITQISPAVLPDDVSERLLSLQRNLGLRYGAFDIIVSQDGDYVYLETNPGGQFLFIEIHAGLPISNAIAKALASQ